MSESRKIHQSDGDTPKDGDHVALDGDKEFRNSRLSLSKEKASPDGAHEKLLQKEDEAKIVRDMRVDMVDAKFVSGDHRNGDPKIELDANKKQFSGLTKEELMKYADDPFWVKLRWFMFLLFWAMWLAMLAGAIIIIVSAPKCASPKEKTWFEKGPLVELESSNYSDAERVLSLLHSSKAQAVFLEVPTYEVLDKPDAVATFKAFVEKAKSFGIKVIVDLTPNYVSIDHPWFQLSENGTAPYSEYFTWAVGKEYSADKPNMPNEWVSTLNKPAWKWSDKRRAFYLHQFAEDQPDLNFNNAAVLQLFTSAVAKWMGAGAAGVRLNKARLMVVNASLAAEGPDTGYGAEPGADHSQYAYYRHTQTADQPALEPMLAAVSAAVDAATTLDPEDTVFTLKEEGDRTELFLLKRTNATELRPTSSAPISVTNVTAAALLLKDRLDGRWPIVQLKADDPEADRELAFFALLLPAAPVFDIKQLDNDTSSESLSHLVEIREDASVEHGNSSVITVQGRVDGANETRDLLACARWKAGHTGYVAVYNPWEAAVRADLTSLSSAPDSLTVHHVSHAAASLTNYTKNYAEQTNNVLVPSKSTVVLSYVPHTTAEN